MAEQKLLVFVDEHGVEYEYTEEMANRDRRILDALLRPVVDAICAKRGITRADLRAGALSKASPPQFHSASAPESAALKRTVDQCHDQT